MQFSLTMAPSTDYPEFGLYAGAVRTHVYPGAFNQFLKTVGEDGSVVPLIKGDSVQIGIGSVSVGFMDNLAYPTSAIDEDDLETGLSDLQDYKDWLGIADTTVLDPFTPITFDAETGEQDEATKAAVWDATRALHYSVGPLPVSKPPNPDADDWYKNLSVMCMTEYDDTEGTGLYYGGACEPLMNGIGFTPAAGMELDTNYSMYQPEAVLCGEQEFHVDSQMMVVPSWCTDTASSEGQFGACNSDRLFYSTAYASIYGGPTVCAPEAVEDLTVLISHSVSDQVYSVTFNNVSPWAMMTDVVVLFMSVLGVQAVTEAVLTLLQRRYRRRQARKRGSRSKDDTEIESLSLEGATPNDILVPAPNGGVIVMEQCP
ncbi:hypothetical protein KIPB_000284 [Kipferlia bialata]|uniref:Uncharacterized protein n=1 Tax=Kipferlia bialata TaxID=797122 RepID=A0A9K3CMA8_9EUKA|nr:hypothetical protein KIPB_000284 [Kipferlia bialata]|eukprot:g284.t1